MADEHKGLSYKRQTLIETLQERLQEKRDEREAAKAKAAEKNQGAIEAITEALQNPSFLVWAASNLRGLGVDVHDKDAFLRKVEQTWPVGAGEGEPGFYDPDEDMKRLIRVYEKAEDDTVIVTVRDEVFNYL